MYYAALLQHNAFIRRPLPHSHLPSCDLPPESCTICDQFTGEQIIAIISSGHVRQRLALLCEHLPDAAVGQVQEPV
jgi:hypothetical protein